MRTRQQAVSAMRRQIDEPSDLVKKTNQCLAVVRAALDAPFIGAANATIAFEKADGVHHDMPPPIGVPCYLETRHPEGHIFLSLGDGFGIGTDFPRSAQVGTFKISSIVKAFGKFRGWSTHYGSHLIPVGSAVPTVDLSKLRAAQQSGGIAFDAGTAIVQNALEKVFDVEITDFGIGHFGPRTRHFYRAWEATFFEKLGSATTPNAVPTMEPLQALGKRAGFKVVA